MKTIKYIALLAIAATLAACESQPGDNIENQRTKPGAVIYERTSGVIYQNVAVATLAQQVNEYINVDTDSQRDSIKNLHFKLYKIDTTDSEFTLSGDIIWIFKTTGRSLSETGTEWSIQARHKGVYPSDGRVVIPEDGYKIRRMERNIFQLTIKEHRTNQLITSGNLALSYTNAQSGNLSGYNVVGSGIMGTLDGSLVVDYNIHTPLLRMATITTLPGIQTSKDMSYGQYIPYIWSPFAYGIIDMEVVQSSANHNIVADLTKSSAMNRIVNITMGGISENWMVSENSW